MYITKDTRERLIRYLYRDLDTDATSVETNELLDILEGKK